VADTIGIRLDTPEASNQKYFLRDGTVPPTFETPVPGFEEQERLERRGNGGGDIAAASRVSTQPAETGYDNLGIRLGGFYELFWRDRLHIIPRRFQAGNVLSDTQAEFEVYNAGTRFLDIRQVLSISDLSAEGINITVGLTGVPYTLGLGETEPYTYIISIAGPPNIDTAYEFQFSGGFALAHDITGQRVIVFNFQPQESLRERWGWQTDLIKHADGTEQRNASRDLPRQQLAHTFLFGDEARNRRLENLLYGRTGSVFGLPLWRDFVLLTASASAGATTLNVTSTDDREFFVGQNVVLRDRGTEAFEVGLVTGLTSTTIDVEQPLVNQWDPDTTEVMPIKLARVQGNYPQRLWAVNAAEVSLLFNVLENHDPGDQGGFTTYQGDPVYEDQLLLARQTYDRTYEHGLKDLGLSNTGAQFQETIRDFPDVAGTIHLAEFTNRAEFNRLRGFMGARRGRQRRFWSATRRADFTPSGVAAAGSTTVNAVLNNYAESVFPGGARRHIEVQYADGTVDRREITGAVVASGLEELVLNAGISQEWSAANVVQVSYLLRYRLDIDELEFVHEWDFNGFLRFTIREIKA